MPSSIRWPRPYVSNPLPPALIAIGGFSGSGKTSLAKALAIFLTNAVHLDSDKVRKEIFGVPETTRLPPGAYTGEATRRVINEMLSRTKEGLSAGKNVVVSALFNTVESRAEEESIAKACGAVFAGIWLQTDVTVLFDRVAKRSNDASDATVEIVKEQTAKNPGPIGWEIIDANAPLEEVLRASLKSISASKKKALG